MRNTWSRERILRHILEREADGLPLNTGGEGIDKQLYSAARRIFGSWRNAILAAGITPEHVLTWDRWSPARILAKIRAISRRQRPLTTDQVDRRYRNLASAARRHFGSWSKAVVAAGVDPGRMQRVIRWTRERVIEAILTRALRSEPLVARLIDPRSLVDAGQRFFGSWQAAVAAAGMDPRAVVMPPRRTKQPRRGTNRGRSSAESRRTPKVWTSERIIKVLKDRVREGAGINAWAVSCEEPSLYRAGRRRFQSWDGAIRAAGFDPSEHRRDRSVARRAGGPVARKSQREEGLRPDRSEKQPT